MYNKLEIQEILTNSVFSMRLADNSFYLPGSGTNAILEITTPGASCPVIFQVQKDFNTSFNSASLQILPNDTYSETTPLPDGIYKIKYSIAPNDRIFVEYYLFRTTSLLTDLSIAICTLLGDKKRTSNKDYEQKIKQLTWIKSLIDAAKLTVEYQGENIEGIELYNEANSLLIKYNGNYKCH